MASRKPEDLHPDLLPLYRWFMEEAAKASIDVLTTCTYRSNQEQDALYAQGRTTAGHIVTNCKGGQSAHNFTINGFPAAKAFDIVPIVNGKPDWESKDPIWQQLGDIGNSVGLNWAGRWAHMREYPHFQLRG